MPGHGTISAAVLWNSLRRKKRSNSLLKKKMKASLASVLWEGKEVQLAYMATYMNVSGEPVSLLVDHFEIKSLADILIVVDDVALPFGKFRLRGEGSTGGHNGLVSIEERLGTPAYPRLRIGIGIPDQEHPSRSAGSGEPLKDYVLSAFDTKEENHMDQLFSNGMEACRAWALDPLAAAMNRINTMEL